MTELEVLEALLASTNSENDIMKKILFVMTGLLVLSFVKLFFRESEIK